MFIFVGDHLVDIPDVDEDVLEWFNIPWTYLN